MRVRPSVLLVGVCLASLAGWGPLRSLEQVPAPLLAPLDALFGMIEPEPAAVEAGLAAARVSHGASAWSAWSAAVLDRPAPTDADTDVVLAPIVSYDAVRRELVVRAPDADLAVDSPVTHRGVLLGFLRAWGKDGTPVVSDGLAKIALLGHRMARPVAAEWRLSAETTQVHFLVEGGAGPDGPRLGPGDRELAPPQGQLAWTRDVGRLGDALPPGLLLGALERGRDVPGGGIDTSTAGAPWTLRPLLDPSDLLYVAIEAPHAATLSCRRVEARLLGRPLRGRVALSRGLVDGVRAGDFVAQDGLLVGRVENVGPFTAHVRVGESSGPLLLLGDDDRLLPLARARSEWPRDVALRQPRELYVAHRLLGGLFAGSLGPGEDGLPRIDVPTFSLQRPVQVVEP